MKKILIPFTLSVLLLFVACSSGGSDASSPSVAEVPPPSSDNPSSPDDPPSSDVSSFLPKFSTSFFVKSLAAGDFSKGWPGLLDSTTLTITRPYLMYPSYSLERVTSILQNKDSKALKVLAPRAVKATLDYIANLEQHYAGTNMVGDGLRRDVLENGHVVRVYQYLAGENGIFDTDTTYSSLVEFDPAGNDTFAMMWSKEPVKRLLLFSSIANPDTSDINHPKAYSFIAAYQDASSFNLKSAVVASDTDFFNTGAYSVLTQLAYDASSGAFQSVESYRVADAPSKQRAEARLVIQGNTKTGHAGFVETKNGSLGLATKRFYFGSPLDVLAYKGLVDLLNVQNVEDGVAPKALIDDAGTTNIPRAVISITNIKALGLEAFSGDLFIK